MFRYLMAEVWRVDIFACKAKWSHEREIELILSDREVAGRAIIRFPRRGYMLEKHFSR